MPVLRIQAASSGADVMRGASRVAGADAGVTSCAPPGMNEKPSSLAKKRRQATR